MKNSEDFPFLIFHFSFAIYSTKSERNPTLGPFPIVNEKWKMKNEKWKIRFFICPKSS